MNSSKRAAMVLALWMGSGALWGGEPGNPWQGLPEGAGREEVFYTCGACHSLMLVQQQRLSRAVWAETLAWMVTEK
ncbi:MAG: hypothetical protein HQL88_10295, partial [Magnetococcales bacterium]|nr:hypothetical protein [Magnetococcales bacterium]